MPAQKRPFEPGTRLWATGFKLSQKCGKIIRNCPPTYVECTCGGQNVSEEAIHRKNICYATHVMPVMPDGNPNFKKNIGFTYLQFFDTKDEAEQHYMGLLKREQDNIKAIAKALERRSDDIDALMAEATTRHAREASGN